VRERDSLLFILFLLSRQQTVKQYYVGVGIGYCGINVLAFRGPRNPARVRELALTDPMMSEMAMLQQLPLKCAH